ncbi:MAG: coiled-coil domain-containing protein [Planctomycetota bacterium]|jgi:hypothetical protein
MSIPVGRIRRLPGRRPLAAALLASASAMSACSGPPASPDLDSSEPAATQRPKDQMVTREDRQLLVFSRTVLNPSGDIDPQTRRHAAQELIAMDATEAIDALDEALRSGEPPVVGAVIDAMELSAQPVPGLLPAAVATLQEAQGETLEKLSLLLPRYGPQALDLVAQYAHNRDLPPARRLGPIHALAKFRSRESAVQLMALLDQERAAPPEITAAAGKSLEGLTGLPYGTDAQEWRRWWEKLKDEPIEDWLRIMVTHLSARTTELEQQIQQNKQANHVTAERLAQTLRELFLALSVEDQLDRLPELLGDDLTPVREFAVGRVERRLRDSERVPSPVQDKLAERVRDRTEVPALRLSAARLLNDLQYPATADLVAAAVAEETDQVIAASYLEILAKRPAPSGLDPILLWINDPEAGESAADALWAMITRDIIDEERLPTTRRAARAAFEWRGTAAHAKLLGALGEREDQARVEGLLDAADPGLRRAAAEGLAWAGARDPLLQRAGDEEVYPFAVRVLAQGPADLSTLRSLAELAPPEAHREQWAQAVEAVAGKLFPADLLATDEMLASFGHVDLRLRAAVLARVTDLPPEAAPADLRAALVARLAEIRIALGEFTLAYELGQRLQGVPLTSALTQLKFRAAALAGHYEEAAALNGDALAWVLLLSEIAQEHPDAAVAVREEILRQFEEQLVGEAKVIFDAASERLPPSALTTGSSESLE